MKINKIILYLSVYFILNLNISYAQTFEQWKIDFKILAISKGISASTFDNVMRDAKFLPKVIEYDRYQPEFYEDTKTYISKRLKKKVISGMKIYKNNQKLIDTVEVFGVEKELLLALMGIETNYGPC